MFLVALLIGCALVVWYSVERLPFCVESNALMNEDKLITNFPEISFTNWIGSHNMFIQQNILYLVIPIIAVLPFGKSFYADINGGFIKGVCTRTQKSRYLIAKYIAVFISGGCAVTIPMVLSFVASSAFLPTMLPEASYVYTNIFSTYKWADLLFSAPFLYVFLNLCVVFVFSGLIACTSLFISYFSSKSFLVYIFPFFVCIFSSFLCELLELNEFSIRNVMTTTGEESTTFSVILLTVLLFVLSFPPYYILGVRKDVL